MYLSSLFKSVKLSTVKKAESLWISFALDPRFDDDWFVDLLRIQYFLLTLPLLSLPVPETPSSEKHASLANTAFFLCIIYYMLTCTDLQRLLHVTICNP